MKNNNEITSSIDFEFEKYLEKIEDPKNNQGFNRALTRKATPLQIAKYQLCKSILAYQLKNNLDDEILTKELDLSLAEVEDILFCEIEKFTLDRLLSYASKLFFPIQIKIITKEKNNFNVRTI